MVGGGDEPVAEHNGESFELTAQFEKADTEKRPGPESELKTVSKPQKTNQDHS